MNNFGIYLISIYTSIGALVHIIHSSYTMIDKIYETPYSDKYEMKLIGSTALSYTKKITDLIILGLAKCIEDTIFLINEMDGTNINFWTDLKTYKYFDKAEIVRHLSNIIKHHQSHIDSTKSKDAKELIYKFGYTDGSPVYDNFISEKGITIIKFCYYIRTFCLEIASQYSKIHNYPGQNVPEKKYITI